jgi:hypothetical protein
VNRKSLSVPHTLVTIDLHLSTNVLCDISTKVTLHRDLSINPATKTSDFFIGEVSHASIRIDVGSFERTLRRGQSNPKDVGQRHLNPLFTGDVNTRNSSHLVPLPSSLNLAAACGAGFHKSLARCRDDV